MPIGIPGASRPRPGKRHLERPKAKRSYNPNDVGTALAHLAQARTKGRRKMKRVK